ERLGRTNADAAGSLMRASATLAGPVLLPSIDERLGLVDAAEDSWTAEWVKDVATAYETCGEDVACHLAALGDVNVDVWRYKSAQFVAARMSSDQGLAVLARMEDAPRPDWLAVALDQRLSHPTKVEVTRVAKLTQRASPASALFALGSACSRLEWPLEELAIRLEVRERVTR